MPKKEKNTLYKALLLLVKILLKSTLKVVGTEKIPKTGGFILASNHGSVFDPLIIMLALYRLIKRFLLPNKKVYWITNIAVLDRFYLFFLKKNCGCLPSTGKGLLKSISLLNDGNPIGIFPAGPNLDNEKNITGGKTGVAYMALLSGASVVPVVCKCPKTNTFFQGLLGFFLLKKVEFGEPIRFPKKDRLYLKKHPDVVEHTIKIIMHEIAKTSGGKYDP